VTLRCSQGRLGVAGLWGGGGEVEPQGAGIVFAQEVGHIHGGAAAFAELATAEVEAFMVTRDKSPSL